MRENQFSTWFSHDEYVGVKCMRTLPCCTRKSRTRWVLGLLTLSQMTWISCRSRWLGAIAGKKATKCSLVWPPPPFPTTPPLALAGDDVGKEGDELLAGVARRGLAQPLAGGGVQRREQAQCAVSLVLESVARGPPWRQRQHSVLAIERLDGGLLIDAEHSSTAPLKQHPICG